MERDLERERDMDRGAEERGRGGEVIIHILLLTHLSCYPALVILLNSANNHGYHDNALLGSVNIR